jgi:hypothetical protein
VNTTEKQTPLNNLDIHKKYLQNSNTHTDSSILKSQQKFTVRMNTLHDADFLRS